MKKKNILLFSTVLGLSLIGGNVVTAAEYTGALNATSKGTVVFGGDDENKSGVPDPANPDTPVVPDGPAGTDPLNPSTADLRIMYVPNLDFGKSKRTIDRVEQLVSTIKVKDIDASGNVSTTTREVVPFATTLDLRTVRSGWTLSVSASPFKQNNTHTLTNSYIQLNNLNYVGGGTVNTAPIPTTLSASYNLQANQKTNIAKADQSASAGQGIGKFSLAFGKSKTNVTDFGTNTPRSATDGAVFVKEANQTVNEATYTSTLTWELSPTVASLAN